MWIERTKFWMCFVPGRNSPTVQHETLQQAENEAERLCRKTGLDVYILEAVQGASPPISPPVESFYL